VFSPHTLSWLFSEGLKDSWERSSQNAVKASQMVTPNGRNQWKWGSNWCYHRVRNGVLTPNKKNDIEGSFPPTVEDMLQDVM